MAKFRFSSWLTALLGAGIVTNAAAQTAVLKDYKTGSQIPYGGKQQAGAIQVPVKFSARQPMFRGVWVATVENIDFPKHAAAGEFINDYKQVMNNLKRLHFNAVLFQVRANNDAFYPSSLNPWSRWLTGKEGVGIKDFDPLKYMVSEAHEEVEALAVHAHGVHAHVHEDLDAVVTGGTDGMGLSHTLLGPFGKGLAHSLGGKHGGSGMSSHGSTRPLTAAHTTCSMAATGVGVDGALGSPWALPAAARSASSCSLVNPKREELASVP